KTNQDSEKENLTSENEHS
ncbi:unnamed protein product, partial [Allacma fusca]